MVLMGDGSLQWGGTSRVSGDGHARFCERLGVKFPGATRRGSENIGKIVPDFNNTRVAILTRSATAISSPIVSCWLSIK